MIRRLLRSTALALALSVAGPAVTSDIFVYASVEAHGDGIPDWIHASCCGPKDVHHLRPDQVTDHGDYYTVEGTPQQVPKTTPPLYNSQDGDYWAFWSASGYVYCLFVPMDF